MRSIACCVVLALAACSEPKPTGDAGPGGAGGSGGGVGGAAGTQGQGVLLLATEQPMGLLVPPPADAGDITLLAIDPDAGGADPIEALRMGPAGRTFSPAAIAGTVLPRLEADADGGVWLPAWLLTHADGGRQAVRAFTTVAERFAAASFVEVPSFSSTRYFRDGTYAVFNRFPDKVTYELGEAFYVLGGVHPPEGATHAGTVQFAVSGPLALRIFSPSFDLSPTGLVFEPNTVNLQCTAVGVGVITITLTLTAQSKLGPGAQPQTLAMEQRVACARPPPITPQPPPAASPFIAEPMGWERDVRNLAYALQSERLVPADLAVQAFPPCGAGTKPCDIGVVYPMRVRVENRSTQWPLRHEWAAVLGSVPVAPFSLPRFREDMHRQAILRYPATIPIGEGKDFFVNFTCEREGRGHLVYQVSGGHSAARSEHGWLRIPLGVIPCGGKGDAVMLADNTRLTRSGSTWTAAATGVTANLIAASDDLGRYFAALNEHDVALDQVPAFTSRRGLPRFRFQSGRQTATWTHSGTGYAQTGLVGGAAFNATDSLTVTGFADDGGVALRPDGGPAVVTLSAPPPLPAPASFFGPLAGLATRVHLPDGTFDTLYVAVTTPSPRGGTGGLFRTVAAADMALDGGLRSAPLMDDAALRVLDDWALDAGTVYVAAFRQVSEPDFFWEADGGALAVPVQAGRMLQLNVRDLSP